ncbi:ATP-binding cassette domain-containing protein [Schaedlerella sp.]|jgi:ABC-type multidrug transport system ATPase subunit|uniref:ATP-binding cassette domain-containing protein n=1 Tax=Schaedlerella sp. TaxID=2676057 RepID=UPI0013630327|nr:ATP-binding cassette domain-containing protein [uncultured Schaedlerella sp.]MCI8767922.1 ATP-binding cassette domain-containing protein [Ruminococcus sp.]MCI9328361.1 ATP-binding cassette domain-containing protein [Ruminococcus sp.]NBJ02902.1 ATP-binding cassette domain-containing protein [Lachnospiraceae bacterium]
MESIITTQALTKQYGSKPVVRDLALKVPPGSIYGFLGPNGAGKSTTMKMLLGLIKPTAGSIFILGKPMLEENRLEILKNTGSLIESPSYYGHLSARENLQIICTLKNVLETGIDDVLRIVRLEKQQDKKVKNYSLGMKQRLGLAAALLGHPRLLLLDEPTNGLDPSGIQEMRELICSLPGKYGMTVLVSSHLLSEIDQMATHVGIIDRGVLIFQNDLASLHHHSRARIRLRTTDDGQAFRLLKKARLPVAASKDGSGLFLHSVEDSCVLRCGHLLTDQKIGILRLEEMQMSLEEIFLNLTGKQASL